jgi:hypothetical protein
MSDGSVGRRAKRSAAAAVCRARHAFDDAAAPYSAAELQRERELNRTSV